MKTYFDTAVRENRYYSEDWTFCENWRDLGGKVWVDKRVLLRHTGTYVFDFAQQEPLYKALHEIAQQNAPAAAGPAPEPAPVPEPELIASNTVEETVAKTAKPKKKKA
jgi:hypothetical protein